MNISSIRSRWAAVGAAVAVSLGAGGIGITHATISSGERPVYIPIEPCRLVDNRPAGIGEDTSVVYSGWGAVGACNLPTTSTGLALNVTAVGATQQTNLRFYPADAGVPDTANLNPTPGAPPTPNAVNVDLDSSGEFGVYNRFGTVATVIDVMGYYEDHDHDDRYAPISENVEGAIDSINDEAIALSSTDTVILSATVDTETSGYVMADATVRFSGTGALNSIRCSLSTSTSLDSSSVMIHDVESSQFGTIAMSRGFVENKTIIIPSLDDDEMTVNVVCDERSGVVTVGEGALTLTFVPDGDAAGLIIVVPLDEGASDGGVDGG